MVLIKTRGYFDEGRQCLGLVKLMLMPHSLFSEKSEILRHVTSSTSYIKSYILAKQLILASRNDDIDNIIKFASQLIRV